MRKLGFLWLTIMALMTGCASNEAASVGVIGGADGPTFIHVAWQFGNLGILIVVVIAVICIVRRK